MHMLKIQGSNRLLRHKIAYQNFATQSVHVPTTEKRPRGYKHKTKFPISVRNTKNSLRPSNQLAPTQPSINSGNWSYAPPSTCSLHHAVPAFNPRGPQRLSRNARHENARAKVSPCLGAAPHHGVLNPSINVCGLHSWIHLQPQYGPKRIAEVLYRLLLFCRL